MSHLHNRLPSIWISLFWKKKFSDIVQTCLLRSHTTISPGYTFKLHYSQNWFSIKNILANCVQSQHHFKIYYSGGFHPGTFSPLIVHVTFSVEPPLNTYPPITLDQSHLTWRTLWFTYKKIIIKLETFCNICLVQTFFFHQICSVSRQSVSLYLFGVFKYSSLNPPTFFNRPITAMVVRILIRERTLC